MSSTLLEVTRAAHEEVEQLEQLIVKDLQKQPTSNHQRRIQNHRVRNRIEAITSTTERLVGIYEDKDNARKDEIAALEGQTAFYDRLKEIHRRQPEPRVVVDAAEELLKEEVPHVEFSGEEGYGRYLDLHELYNQYINSIFGEPIEYSAYLNIFSQPGKIVSGKRDRVEGSVSGSVSMLHSLKLTRQYREYLERMLEYLIDFFRRTEPLQDLDRIFLKVETEFEHQWEAGKVEGWEKMEVDSAAIDLDYYSTVEELMEVGAEKLREALAAIGLKTGGTVRQLAERLFLIKYTPIEQLDKKNFAKQTADSKEIALKEAKMKRLCELLNETILQTKENVEKKQAWTYEEMEAERREREEEEDIQADHSESDDDEEQKIHNPLKLPMGWDGKPIPHWLYKLHGLGQEFKCEICGNQSYWGRREFERHFKDSLHQNGMRRLGIPNTNNFNEITSIQEAKLLWGRIQERQRVNIWQPELEEEYEDKDGNIYNKKTYTDLQRQGLI